MSLKISIIHPQFLHFHNNFNESLMTIAVSLDFPETIIHMWPISISQFKPVDRKIKISQLQIRIEEGILQVCILYNFAWYFCAISYSTMIQKNRPFFWCWVNNFAHSLTFRLNNIIVHYTLLFKRKKKQFTSRSEIELLNHFAELRIYSI